MKKGILILFVAFLTFMLSQNVYATSFYSLRLNDIYLHKQSLQYNQYKYAGAIKERGTDRATYCIEPFSDLIEEYDDYIEYPTYNAAFGLTEEQYTRINDLAFFGYGYGNHVENKWASITQVLIWRTVNPGDTFEWVDNLYQKNIITPYEAEIAEIEALIADKNTKPSFINGETLDIYGHTELDDTNDILSKFLIEDSSGVNVSIDNNKLVIDTVDGSNTGEVKLIRIGDFIPGSFFYHSGSQNVMLRGGYTPLKLSLNINVVKGSISILKVDKDFDTNTSQGEGNINGAVFELYDEENNLVDTITLDAEGKAKIEDLYLGKYTLKEVTPGEGYLLNDDTYDIELTKDNLDVEITISNKVIESKLKITKLFGTKYDFVKSTMKPESGISFDIFDSNDNLIATLTTDEYGTCEILLPYGTYKVVQKNTTSNYQMVDDKYVTIDESSPEEINLVLNDVEIEVPNAGLY